ncbi:metal-dependent hydrolase [soil metagenome]
MDPVTQGALGGVVGLVVAGGRAHRRAAGFVGVVAGLLPDADVFIRSARDPLLAIEYHRHFTHAWIFQPVVAAVAVLLVVGVLGLFRRRPPAGALILPALLGALSHPFCDLWTSYGTRVWWPFAATREAFDWVSVIDPLVTLPLLAGLVGALWRPGRRCWAVAALVWVGAYLALASVQQGRAREALGEHLARAGVVPERLTVKPSFGNIIVWRGLWIAGGKVHAAAVRAGKEVTVREGESAELVEAWESGGVQQRDFERFAHFSDRWLIRHPDDPEVIGDARYAMLPDSLRPLWGIGVGGDPGEHVTWETFRGRDRGGFARLWQMVLGAEGSGPAE